MNLKKLSTLAIAGVAALAVSGSALANVCAFDTVPAATLLYPFVALDYNNPVDGLNTNIAVTNVSDQAQIVHWTIWTDRSEGIFDFNFVLSGYDVETMNMRDLLIAGDIPATGTSGGLVVNGGFPFDDGPIDVVNGLLPDAESTSARSGDCRPGDPGYPAFTKTDDLPASTLLLFRQLLQQTQNASKTHDDCLGTVGPLESPTWFDSLDDSGPTWFYITADVVQSCNLFFPDLDAAYWDTEVFRDTDANVLMGDVLWTNNGARFSEADNAVHIEADADLGTVATGDGFGDPISFYYRYSTDRGNTPDNREPLPTAWGFRYFGVGDAALGTYIRAWKGSTFNTSITDLVSTTGTRRVLDCLAYTYYAWDEDENVITATGNPWSQPGGVVVRPNLLPLETQEVSADVFNTPGDKGWMLFVWHPSNDDLRPDARADIWQTWMGVKYTAFETFSAAMGATVMGNYGCFSDQTLPGLGIGYDYVDAITGYVESPGSW